MGDRGITIFSGRGTSRLNRKPVALDPSSAPLDERTIMDLMVFIKEFASHVQFKDLEDKPAGDWSVFYRNNLAFIIAGIGTTPIERLVTRYKSTARWFEQTPDKEEKQEALLQLFNYTLELFRLVDGWYTSARYDLVHMEENRLLEQLSNAIVQKLRTELLKLLEWYRVMDYPAPVTSQSGQGFNYVWNLESVLSTPRSKESRQPNLEQIAWEITVIHRTVMDTITYLKGQAAPLLKEVLTSYPYHSPDSSLLLSFLKLYGYVQQDINQITQRHLDYYYIQILRQRMHPALPDQVHICFLPSDHILKSTLPQGTLLAAGTDPEGMEYAYSTDHDVEISRVRISDLRIIHVAKNPAIGISTNYQSVSNIYAQTVEIDSNGFALDTTKNPNPFDILGNDQSAIRSDQRQMQQAQVGFAVTSPVLMLREGDRKIRLTYHFSLKSLTALIAFIEEVSVSESISADSAFYKILRNVFQVRLTSIDGWFQTPNYQICPPESWSSGSFHIDLLLDISDPPIVRYDPLIHGEGYDSDWPILELVLSSEEAMYAYSYLKNLSVESCRIDVSVSYAKDIQVFNDLGRLDINKPFFPFGSTPGLGSYFLFGNDELVRKHITDLSLQIQWHNLPRNEGGFGDHYKGYKKNITSSSFKAGITALTGFRFLPAREENIQQVELFTEDAGTKKLTDQLTVSSISLERFKLKPDFGNVDLSDFNGQTKSGFFKFQISAPDMGFGFSDFPKLFSEAIVENAQAGSGLLNFKDKAPVELPKEPYAPQIRSMSLNYSATSTLFFDPAQVASNEKNSREKVYHLHPFGKLKIFDQGLPGSVSLLPQFDEDGYLLIGLEGVHAPVQLSLYLELRPGSGLAEDDPLIPKTVWKYLVGDTWRSFTQDEVLFDGTNRFTTSGIIQLQLPATINDQHHILPSGKCWIAAQASGNTHVLSQVLFIRTNAARATWHIHKPGAQWEKTIPAGQITGLLRSDSQVNGVIQPFTSFGGRPQESPDDFYIRVSERLMHRNRIVTAEDYEKMILEKFPQVFQAVCLNHFTHPAFVERGSVRIVVIPKLRSETVFEQPRLDFNILQAIREYVDGLSSPFASVSVVNPNYERVRINCKIRFETTQNTGQYTRRLETDLRKFLCPWFGAKQQEMILGTSLEQEEILAFIYGLDYVRFVSRFSVVVIHKTEGSYNLSDSASRTDNQAAIAASNPWSVFIPDESHEIELVDHLTHQSPEQTRIETMRIGSSFVIMDQKEEDIILPMPDLDKDTFFAVEINI
jgi:hypothetical protein